MGRVAEEETVIFEVVDDERRYCGGVYDIFAVFIFTFQVEGVGAVGEEELDELLLLVETDGGGRVLRDLNGLGIIGLVGLVG